jgi:hypothetical protein
MMQGARRANIPAIFNRRATPQNRMHRFPNADVFVGRDTRPRENASYLSCVIMFALQLNRYAADPWGILKDSKDRELQLPRASQRAELEDGATAGIEEVGFP